ncbi:hypothetical protein LEQ06_16520 [Paraclostridium sp. AKS46]|nr:hypothetical protein [Paraclostridium sp. AKS46]
MNNYINITDKSIIEKLIDKIDETIINMYDDRECEEYILYKDNEEVAFIRFVVTLNYADMVFWCLDPSCEYVKEKTSELVNTFIKQHNLNVSSSLLGVQNKYIKLLEEIGFNNRIHLREHLYIENEYYDVIYLVKSRKDENV